MVKGFGFILSIIVEALRECKAIREAIRKLLAELEDLLLKVLKRLSGKALEALDWLILHVESIGLNLISLDLFGAAKYFTEEIEKDLGKLTESVGQIVASDYDSIDDAIDGLESAQVKAKSIFDKLMNAVDTAMLENQWHCIAFVSGTSLLGGVAGGAVGAVQASAAAAANQSSLSSLITMFRATSIGTSLLGSGSTSSGIGAWFGTTAMASAAPVAAAAGVGVAVGAAAGLGLGVPFYAIKQNRIRAEARNRFIDLDTAVRQLKIKARRLLRTTEGKRRGIEIQDLIAQLEKLITNKDG